MFIYEPSVPSLARVLTHQGKVRDTYHLPGYDHLLLIVATDRVSTHNIVHVSTIAGKGIILTRMSVFWMNRLAPIRTHLVASGNDIYTYLPAGLEYPADLHERALVVKRLDMIPVEFILRSRAAGSWFKDYKGANVDPYQLKIRDGLELMSLFYQDGFPIFTPTDKSEDDLPLVSRDVELQYSEAYKIGLV